MAKKTKLKKGWGKSILVYYSVLFITILIIGGFYTAKSVYAQGATPQGIPQVLNKLDTLETKLDTLETKTDNLQTKVDQLPQNIWEYTNRTLTSFGTLVSDIWSYSERTLTSFGTLVSDIWSYSGRSLDNISNITQGVWEYSARSLTSFGTLISDIWSYSGRSLDNISNITQGVWEYSDRSLTSFGTLVSDIWSNTTRTLTSGTSIAQDIWNATTRKLTSRQIGDLEYIVGVTESGTVSQVADQPAQENVEYNVELVRKATFDFAGFADSGTTLTLVDLELSEYPDDYWNNYELIMMSGVNASQKRVICDFDQASYTITLCSPFDNSIASGDKYVISHERKLVHAIWNWSQRTLTSAANIAGDIWEYPNRTLTDFGTLVADIWNYPTRTLTSLGSLAADIWSNTFVPIRRLTDVTLTSGGDLATKADVEAIPGGGVGAGFAGQVLVIETHSVSEYFQGQTGTTVIMVKYNDVPISGLTPTGTYYKPDNSVWLSGQSFTEIGTTGAYYHNFDIPQDAALGVYKVIVEATYIFGGDSYSDTFTEADGPASNWLVRSGNWAVESNIYKQTREDYWNTSVIKDASAYDWQDYSFEAKVRRDSSVGDLGLYGRWLDNSNYYNLHFQDTWGGAWQKLTLKRGDQYLAYVDYSIVTGTWYTLKIVFSGNNIKGYVNDVLKIDYYDGNPIQKGKIGLRANYITASFDDVNVTVGGQTVDSYITKDFKVASYTDYQAQWTTHFACDGTVLAGQQYRATLYLYDAKSDLSDAVSTPTITIYDSTRSKVVDGLPMTPLSTGIYEYVTTISSGANTGRWEAIVTVDIGGAAPIQTGGYFMVEPSGM